ncbi:hypothetical protein [Telluribacter sp. SYSU D00476]|uniref:hypothetical protein n=1 Tax=Telluribacter sp. SYSU D00476 TaxID=2811430 RepID=UPI001FF1FD27|nr:hypothetical protein [Telluribacter sp. SYSU D00476]
MDKKKQILEHCQEAHALTEQCYLEQQAIKGSPEWLEKRKYLLADLSIHMVQAALQQDKADPALIRRSLYSLLMICEDFIPDAELLPMAQKLMEQQKVTD